MTTIAGVDAPRPVSTASGRRADGGVAWSAIRLTLGVLLIYLSTAGGSLTSTDAVVHYEVTRSIVERGTVAISPDVRGIPVSEGRDGRLYSQFGIGQSLYNIPFYLAARAIERSTESWRRRPELLTKAAVALGNTVASAAVVGVTFLFAWRVSGDLRAARFAALSLAFGSALWPYSKFGFNAPLTALFLVSATYWIGRGRWAPRRLIVAGLFVGGGWLVRHEFVIVVLPIALSIALALQVDPRSRRSQLLALAPGVIAGGLGWVIYNFVRFGRPTYVGYTPAFTGKGYWPLLFSPGGSVFLYSPIAAAGLVALLVSMRRSDPRLSGLLSGMCLTIYAFFGALEDWPGGRSYGARYLVPILPLLCLPLAVWWRDADVRTRRWLMSFAIISAIIQVPGVIVDYAKVSQEFARRATVDERLERQYRWSSSGLVLNAEAAYRAVPQNIRYLTGAARPPAVSPADSSSGHGFSQQFSFSLDFWWLYLFYFGFISARAAVSLGTILAAAGIMLVSVKPQV
jgi:hypothetical protein